MSAAVIRLMLWTLVRDLVEDQNAREFFFSQLVTTPIGGGK